MVYSQQRTDNEPVAQRHVAANLEPGFPAVIALLTIQIEDTIKIENLMIDIQVHAEGTKIRRRARRAPDGSTGLFFAALFQAALAFIA